MKTAIKASALDKVLGHLENLDTLNLTILVQRLARERKLFETVFNSIHEGIVVLNSTHVVSYANVAALRLIGFPAEEIGRGVLGRWVPGLVGLHVGSSFSRELAIAYPEPRLLRLYGVPFSIKDEGDLQQLLILQDITADKASEQTLLEEEKIASIFQLAAGVAHEIGNPLNTLSIHLQLLKRCSDASDQHTLAICLQEVDRLSDIIKHFLEAIRPQPLVWKAVDLIALIEEVLKFHAPEIHNLGIAVSLELPADFPSIQGDPHQLKQVFYNGIKNAIDALRQGGTLRVVASVRENEALIQLIDSGQGIAEADLPQIFEPYFTTRPSGHGLGMLIIHRIMRAHGGRVSLDTHAGLGTALTLHFAVAQEQRQING